MSVGAAGAAPRQPEPPAVVTAFEVKGAVDYDKLINEFGSQVCVLVARVRGH